MKGKFYKAANGRECYEIFSASAEFLFEIEEILNARFGCSALERPIFGLDTIITTCHKEETKLLLGWDVWSGCYLMSDSLAGDPLVLEIGAYVNSILDGEEYEKYIECS